MTQKFKACTRGLVVLWLQPRHFWPNGWNMLSKTLARSTLTYPRASLQFVVEATITMQRPPQPLQNRHIVHTATAADVKCAAPKGASLVLHPAIVCPRKRPKYCYIHMYNSISLVGERPRTFSCTAGKCAHSSVYNKLDPSGYVYTAGTFPQQIEELRRAR